MGSHQIQRLEGPFEAITALTLLAASVLAAYPVVPSLAALALIGSLVPGRAAAWMRALAILGGAAYAMPRTISDVELVAISRVTPYVAGGVAIAIVLGGIGCRVRRTSYGLAAGTLAGLLVSSIGVYSTRATFRYPIYRATVESTPAPYDLIPLAPFVVAWQIWSDLDRAEPFRIAYAVGWDNFNGHTAFRYPLLGSRLQNTVLYVPPTRDGEIIDYRERDRLLAKLDFRAWVRRLIEQRIEIVVAAIPGVPELGWMQSHPNVFVPFSKSPDGTWTWAFRVVSAEAESLLDTSMPSDESWHEQD